MSPGRSPSNGLTDQITFVPGNSTDVELPERVDIVLTELLSSEPLGQRMLPTLRDAGARFLKPEGRMIPSGLAIHAAGIWSSYFGDRRRWESERLERARTLAPSYGLDLSPLVDAYSEQLRADHDDDSYEQYLADDSAAGDRILTGEATVHAYDLLALEEEAAREAAFTLDVREEGLLNGMSTWWSAKIDDESRLTTSPYSPQRPSCWSQIARPVAPVHVRPGDRVSATAYLDPDGRSRVRYALNADPRESQDAAATVSR